MLWRSACWKALLGRATRFLRLLRGEVPPALLLSALHHHVIPPLTFHPTFDLLPPNQGSTCCQYTLVFGEAHLKDCFMKYPWWALPMYGYKRMVTVESQSSKINNTVLSYYSIGDRKESRCHPINNIYWENSLYTMWNLICFYSPFLQTLMIPLYYFPLLCDAS